MQPENSRTVGRTSTLVFWRTATATLRCNQLFYITRMLQQPVVVTHIRHMIQ